MQGGNDENKSVVERWSRGFETSAWQVFTPQLLDVRSPQIVPSRERCQMSWDPVYKLVKRIPRGRVTTYGALAKKLQLPGGARAVGYAMAATPRGRGIPWHRVMGAGGKVRMPEPYASMQRRLLESEGVVFDYSHVNMEQYGWSPSSRGKRSGKGKRLGLRNTPERAAGAKPRRRKRAAKHPWQIE
jgi:methylated-DNA-protein-cysteine methyltransferase related protein